MDDLTQEQINAALNVGLQVEIRVLRAALESIAKSTCCGDCQEAKCVAVKTLYG